MVQTSSRYQIYLHDLKKLGLGNFFVVRLKKRYFSRQLIYLLKKPYVTINNNRLYIDKTDTVVSEMLISEGVWEPFVTQIFNQSLKPGNVVVDIGANIGYYTLISSLQVCKKGQIYAFEPSRQSFNYLQQTINFNQLTNIISIPKAVGSKTTTGKIYYNPENYGDNRTYDSGERRTTENIDIISLDDYFSNSKEVIDLMKIDIQGYEMNALTGMQKLLAKKRIRNIISELWPGGLVQAGTSWEKYIALLKSAGFKIYQIDETNNTLIPFSTQKIKKAYSQDPTYTTNVLCKLPNP